MRRAIRKAIGAAAVCSILAATAASAVVSSVQGEGSCSGPARWHLRVSRESATTIRVRFDISHSDPGDTWQVFLSDNGTRILAGTRVANANGDAHATKIAADRPGRDRVKGSGVDVSAGGSCSGAVTF